MRFTPAYAGKILGEGTLPFTFEVHPRIRGEDFRVYAGELLAEGSPPHTRGRFIAGVRDLLYVRFTPAYAGKIGGPEAARGALRVHPRIRGEDSIAAVMTSEQSGSPPHTRGRLPADEPEVVRGGFTPAYAGKI